MGTHCNALIPIEIIFTATNFKENQGLLWQKIEEIVRLECKVKFFIFIKC
jgi:hypothetical protein